MVEIRKALEDTLKLGVALSSKQLAETCGTTPKNISRYMQSFHNSGAVHIDRWEQLVKSGPPTGFWKWGSGVDAEHPCPNRVRPSKNRPNGRMSSEEVKISRAEARAKAMLEKVSGRPTTHLLLLGLNHPYKWGVAASVDLPDGNPSSGSGSVINSIDKAGQSKGVRGGVQR